MKLRCTSNNMSTYYYTQGRNLKGFLAGTCNSNKNIWRDDAIQSRQLPQSMINLHVVPFLHELSSGNGT